MVSNFLLRTGHMYSYSNDHFKGILFSVILGVVILLLAIPFNKKKFATVFGWVLILAKIWETYVRLFVEHHPRVECLPFNLCNFGIIIGALFLITKNKYLFNMQYMFSAAAIIVLIIPGDFAYNTYYYMLIFFAMHTLEIFIVLYGRVYLNERISYKGYIVSCIFLGLAFLNAAIFNAHYGTNFMFIHDYILNVFSFIPFKIYVPLYIIFNYCLITVMYKLKKPLNM